MPPNLLVKAPLARGESDDSENRHTENDIRTDFVLKNVFAYLLGQNYNFDAITAMNQKEQYIFDNLKETLNAFRDNYADRVKRLCAEISSITEDNVGSIILGVANELFSEGITWSRIIAFFVFVGELALRSIYRNGPKSVVDAIYECFSTYVKETLCAWIEDHNGWVDAISLKLQQVHHIEEEINIMEEEIKKIQGKVADSRCQQQGAAAAMQDFTNLQHYHVHEEDQNYYTAVIPFISENDQNRKKHVCYARKKIKKESSAASAVLETGVQSNNVNQFEKALQICNMSMRANLCKKDQSRIQDFIDYFLYSSKIKVSNPGISYLNDQHNYKNNNSGFNAVAAQTTEISQHKNSNSTSSVKNNEQNFLKDTISATAVPHQNPVPIFKNLDKASNVPNRSENIVTQSAYSIQSPDCEKTEKKTVSFFVNMIKKYDEDDYGIHIDLLKTFMREASADIQSFMFQKYQNNILRFFQNHQKTFYVSGFTSCVYLIKKPFQRKRAI